MPRHAATASSTLHSRSIRCSRPSTAVEAPLPHRTADRSEQPRGDAEEPAAAVDDRAALGRPSSRTGGAHDLRGGPSMPGRATLPNEPASARDGTAAAPLRAAIEHAAADATAATTAAQRSPSFERHAAEPSATPLAGHPVRARHDRGSGAGRRSQDRRRPPCTRRIDEPGFGAALGTQVSLWVRDGVQEARLQLHPAELGPVTVQIALEGQAAHVDFTAAVAATRESIEQSLPALAAALRESGFTLDGRRRLQPCRPGRRATGGASAQARITAIVHARTSAPTTGHAVAAPRRWTRSLLDVYA